MKKMLAHPYKIYSKLKGKTVAFDEETLTLAEVNSLHLSILRASSSPKRLSDVILSASPSKRKEIRRSFKELDELGFFRALKSKPYQKVFNLTPKIHAFRIALTEECNLRCTECFVTKRRNNLKTMSRNTLEAVIKKTISCGAKDKITYHFFGGEPLIRFDHIKHAVSMINKAVESGKMIQPLYTITTNLTILNEEMVKFFKENNFKVGVSVDGPRNINNKFRIYKNGKGSFKDTKLNYYCLIRAGVDTHVLITPHPDFLNQLPKIFRETIRLFPMKTITVNTPFHYHNLSWDIDGEKYARTLVKLIRTAKKFKITVDSAVSPILFSLASNTRRKCPCMFNNGYIMASVSPDGRMSFCSQNWHDVLLADSEKKLKIHINRIDKCESCEARNICGGPCPAFQLISKKRIDRQKCKFMRAILREITANIEIFR